MMHRTNRPGRKVVVALSLSLLCLAAGARPAVAQLSNALTGTTEVEQPTRMGGFNLDLTLSDSSGLNAVGQNYRNELSAYIEPRWAAGRVFFPRSRVWRRLTFSGRFVLGRAITGTSEEYFGTDAGGGGPLTPCSNAVPSDQGLVIDPNDIKRCNPESFSRRTDYSDITLGVALPRFTTIPVIGVDVSTSIRGTIPISKQSQFASLRFGLSGNGNFGRNFGKVRVGYTVGATKNFHEYTTAGLEPQNGGSAAQLGNNGYSAIAGTGISNLYADPTRLGSGGVNSSFSFSNGLSASMPFSEKWSGDVLYMWTDGFSYKHSCMVSVSGQMIDTCATGAAVAANSGSSLDEGRGHRRAQVFWVTVNYEWRPWMAFSLAWVNWAPREKPNGDYRQPFVSTDYNAFTSVMLSATTSLEKVLEALPGKR